MEALHEFLFENDTLRHLDLTECGLTADMIMHLCKLAKTCSQLCGLHLSGNPGLSVGLQERILARMDATHEERFHMPSFQHALNSAHGGSKEFKRDKQLAETVQLKRIKK
jgi:hypothetical protein